MHVILLGTAAGGGFPQWNCWCPSCRAARETPELARPRTQSSIAFSADGARWFLGNASPDVREQLGPLPPSRVHRARATCPMEGIVLTDAELDHTLGIALLREGRLLQVIATPSVLRHAREDSRVLPVTAVVRDGADRERGAGLRGRRWSTATAARAASRSRCWRCAAILPASRGTTRGHTVAAFIRDASAGATCAFVPGCGGIPPKLLARLSEADLLLFDGTFWTDDELTRARNFATGTALRMGHVPVAGSEGSLAMLSRLPCRQKVYTHINNTNPMLLERSDERAMVESAGMSWARMGCDSRSEARVLRDRWHRLPRRGML